MSAASGERERLLSILGRVRAGLATVEDMAHVMGAADDTIAALETENAALRAECAEWVKLYRRAFNEAAGLTNYVEDRPGLRVAERKLAAIEAEARDLAANHARNERVIKGETK